MRDDLHWQEKLKVLVSPRREVMKNGIVCNCQVPLQEIDEEFAGGHGKELGCVRKLKRSLIELSPEEEESHHGMLKNPDRRRIQGCRGGRA